MNDAVHQFLQLLLQGMTWVFHTAETLWIWSWTQVTAAFNIDWAGLPAWKIAFGIAALAILAMMLVTMFIRGFRSARLGRLRRVPLPRRKGKPARKAV